MPSNAKIHSYIPKNVELTGNLQLREGIRIEGRFKGSITSTSAVHIGADARVDAELTVKNLFCSGSLEGTVQAAHAVDVRLPGHVSAAIDCAELNLEKGVFFQGVCLTRKPLGESEERPSVALRATGTASDGAPAEGAGEGEAAQAAAEGATPEESPAPAGQQPPQPGTATTRQPAQRQAGQGGNGSARQPPSRGR